MAECPKSKAIWRLLLFIAQFIPFYSTLYWGNIEMATKGDKTWDLERWIVVWAAVTSKHLKFYIAKLPPRGRLILFTLSVGCRNVLSPLILPPSNLHWRSETYCIFWESLWCFQPLGTCVHNQRIISARPDQLGSIIVLHSLLCHVSLVSGHK